MKFLLIVLLVLVVAAVLLSLRKRRSAGPRLPSARPPGTAGLDEEVALRPDVDPAAVAAARARISADVPDEVLSDALLDATPRQLASMLAAVPAEVMAGAVGRPAGAGAAQPQQASREDLASLKKVSESVDDLEIWSFGDKS
ncbi:hypothetical protein [Deinococcus budaensis]|uniref:Uncharacterized protein n=1 Tax=Deinococcus budaensis TaxID=1665626 RepID=A0A7W8LQH2_9DEIO|nr:hypothetical protein [Deinococcus budaensis]MBB5234592.1 hypothetical protein [Deinococcus budaensis]